MKKMKLAIPAAVMMLAAACAFTGCGKKEEAAETSAESTAAETAAPGETAAAAAEELTGDAKLIAEIQPKKPENMGKVTLGDLTQIEIEAPDPQPITDEDVDLYMQEYVLQGMRVPNDYAITDGNIATIDFVGKKDGVAFDGGTGTDYELNIGSHTFIDGFEEGLIGSKAGDKIDLNLTFPEDYQAEDLAGQDVVFEVTIKKVERPMLVEDFTDADADEFSAGNYKTVAAYRDGVKEALELSSSALAKGELFTNAITAAVQISEAEASEEVIDWQIDMYLQNYDKEIREKYEFGLADLLQMYQQSYSDYRTALKQDPNAETTAKEIAVIYAIADKQGIKYDEAGLKQYLDEYGYEEELVKKNTSKDFLEDTVTRYLVAKYIIGQAKAVNFIPFVDYEAKLSAQIDEAYAEAEAMEATDADTQETEKTE